MATEVDKQLDPNDLMSIKDIVNTIISDESSPISSWLINVIETYLNNTQKTEPLTIDKLFSLTNDMLLTYSITTTQSQSKQLCSKLIELLQINNHLSQFDEPFTVNTKCIALYIDDNKWYPATIIDVIQSGYSYLIEFDGYGNQQNVTIDQIQLKQDPKQEQLQLNNDKLSSSVSLKDSIEASTTNDKELEKLIMSDMSGNALKEKKKYVNDMITLYEVDEEKLAAAINDDDDEKNFLIFMDAKEKDDNNEMDENDVDKYTVGDGKNKRRINPKNDICCICNRTLPLTWHHLIPKCTHNDYIKTHPNVTKLFLNKHGIWICRQCHSAVHGIHSNKELMKSYWKFELLLECGKVQKWIKYVSKQRVTAKGDSRAQKINRVGSLQRDKKDHSTKIKYIQ